MSVYVFLAFVNNLTEISILVVWIIINIFMVNFGLEFTDLVFNYWNRAYNTHVHTKSYYHSIRLIWDHNVPKSECTTEIEWYLFLLLSWSIKINKSSTFFKVLRGLHNKFIVVWVIFVKIDYVVLQKFKFLDLSSL